MRRITGVASLLTAGGLLAFPPLFAAWQSAGVAGSEVGNGTVVLPFVNDHAALFAALYVNGAAVHVTGAVVVLGLHRLLPATRLKWAATISGLAWMGFDLVQNTINLVRVPALATDYAAGANVAGTYDSLNELTTRIMYTGHLGGGIWVALASVLGERAGLFSRKLRGLGLVTGALFATSAVFRPALYPCFLLLPAWLGWTGVTLLRSRRPLPAADARPDVEPVPVG